MIFDGGYAVQRRMENLLLLKPDTLNNGQKLSEIATES